MPKFPMVLLGSAIEIYYVFFSFPSQDPPIWLEMEKSSIKSGLSLETYLYDSDIKVLRKMKENVSNPIVLNMVRVWHETQRYLRISYTNLLSHYCPVWGNPKFIPGRMDVGFKLWAERGIKNIKDLYLEDRLMSFQELITKFDIPRNHFYRYLQIRSFVMSFQKYTIIPPLSSLEKEVTKNCYNEGLFSLLYNM
ncbi:MAG: hypothetical protein ACRCUS_04055, partial [Anaerovoracaceae bacterium]